MKKFLLIFTVLLFVFAFNATMTKAAALTGVVYGPSGSTVRSYVPASSILGMFTTTDAIIAGSTILFNIPNNSALDAPTASDFTIQELGAGSAATAPSVLAYDGDLHTITFTVAAASLSSDTAGVGTFVIKTSSTASGTEIRNPQNAASNHAFAVTTSVSGGVTTISDVTFVVAAASKLAFTTQPTNTAVAGVAIATQPIVTVQDAYGNTITTDSASVVTLASFSNDACTTAKAGALGTLTKTAVSGIADFATQDVRSTLIGATYFKATTPSLTSACSAIVTITPAAASGLTFSVQPATTAYTYVNFSTQPTVVATDAFGNTTLDAAAEVTLLVNADNTPDNCAHATSTSFLGDNSKDTGATFTDLRYNTISSAGIYLCAAADVGGAKYGYSNEIIVYPNAGTSVITHSNTTATTTTTTPTTTVTTAPATTVTTIASMPVASKAISAMTLVEKNSYIMELQTFLIQLLTQLLTLMRK